MPYYIQRPNGTLCQPEFYSHEAATIEAKRREEITEQSRRVIRIKGGRS